ncbi:MAG TPA: hypothetical protein IAA79_02100 [Candidatus Avirikenella pullistercoris]|nr:hypothetical protein [Candidatus Avirikenella pullistercoris]
MHLGKKYRLALTVIILSVLSLAARAQDAAGNVFNPYSVYGLGEFNIQGTSAAKSMAGTGVALRSPVQANNINPASFSAMVQKAFLFSFGMQGVNNYLQTSSFRNSHNNFTMNDVSIVFPITKGLGFGFSVMPYTSVGYKISYNETDPDFIANIGDAQYIYTGGGGINLFKVGFGWEVFKGFSFGANMVYYLGSIERLGQTIVNAVIPSGQEFRTTIISNTDQINVANFEIGIQYNIPLKNKGRNLTLGAVYQPKVSSNIERTRYIYGYGSTITDSISLEVTKSPLKMPHKFSAGVAYNTHNLTLTLDYNFQNWSNAFFMEAGNGMSTTKAQDVRLGFEITPNRTDIRYMMKRWTYRAGVRYNNSYLVRNGNQIKDYAVSVGFGIPLQRGGFSLLNVGGEFGQMGELKNGMVRNTYVKLYVGFNLFTQGWFVRHKFN